MNSAKQFCPSFNVRLAPLETTYVFISKGNSRLKSRSARGSSADGLASASSWAIAWSGFVWLILLGGRGLAFAALQGLVAVATLAAEGTSTWSPFVKVLGETF
jgi:hypothetical protein